MKFYHEHWKWRCVMLHDPAVQRKFFQGNFVAIKEESNKGEVEGLRRHAEVHSVNENEASEEEMLSWVRSVKKFKKRSKKSKNLDIRKMLMARAN